MTTVVTIDAHCNPETTHVFVSHDSGNTIKYLENGEQMIFTIHGHMDILVKEVPKLLRESNG
jgi:hypothetical protein